MDENVEFSIKNDPSIIKKEYLLEIWKKRRSESINNDFKSKTYKIKIKSPPNENKYLIRGNSADLNDCKILNNSAVKFSPNLLMIPIKKKKVDNNVKNSKIKNLHNNNNNKNNFLKVRYVMTDYDRNNNNNNNINFSENRRFNNNFNNVFDNNNYSYNFEQNYNNNNNNYNRNNNYLNNNNFSFKLKKDNYNNNNLNYNNNNLNYNNNNLGYNNNNLNFNNNNLNFNNEDDNYYYDNYSYNNNFNNSMNNNNFNNNNFNNNFDRFNNSDYQRFKNNNQRNFNINDKYNNIINIENMPNNKNMFHNRQRSMTNFYNKKILIDNFNNYIKSDYYNEYSLNDNNNNNFKYSNKTYNNNFTLRNNNNKFFNNNYENNNVRYKNLIEYERNKINNNLNNNRKNNFIKNYNDHNNLNNNTFDNNSIYSNFSNISNNNNNNRNINFNNDKIKYQNLYYNNNKKYYEKINNNNDNINYYNNENEFINFNDYNNNNNQYYNNYNNNNNINEREIYLDNENLPDFNLNKKNKYNINSYKNSTLNSNISYNYNNNNENESYNNISSNYYYSDKINNSVIITSNTKSNPFTFKPNYNNNNNNNNNKNNKKNNNNNNNNNDNNNNNNNNNDNNNNNNNNNDLIVSFNSNISSPLLQMKDNKFAIKQTKKIIKKPPKKSAKIILKNGAHHRTNSELNKTFENYNNFKNLLENITNESSENIFYVNKNQLNFEDFVIINEKFNKIYSSIEEMNFNLINKVCYDYWNFFYNSSTKGNFSLFLNEKNINYFNSLFLISILITYDLSFKEKYFNFFYQTIENILQICYENFLMFIQILINNNFNNEKNIFIDELKYIINNSNINSENYTKKNLLSKIKTNCEIIFNEISDIISHLNQTNYFENILNKKIIDIFNNINFYSENEINSIFSIFILKINKNGSILYQNSNNNNIQIISPIILNNIPKKPLTLILDLDQTIMSFISDNFNEFEGTTRTRPFLYNFLNLMINYYEIIIFTASTRNYADPILDVIEKRKKNYFCYRLYREHCRIINNSYVKDISIINRNLSRIVIVDNMSQNFKLQKENGILISSFWGYDEKDTALLELGEILELIALEMIESGYKIDIRDEIKKYKNNI